MIATVATHASSAPPPPSSEAKSAAAEPGFQTALSSSLESAKAGDNAASTAAQRPDTAKPQANEPERGRSGKKRETVEAATTGEPTLDTAAVTQPVALALPVPLPVSLPLPVTLSSNLPSGPTNDAPVGTGALSTQTIVSAAPAQMANSIASNTAAQQVPAARETGTGLLGLPSAQSTANDVRGAQVAAPPEVAKAAAPQPGSVLPTQEASHSRNSTGDSQAISIPLAQAPVPDIKVLATTTVQAPDHATPGAALAPTPAPVHATDGQNGGLAAVAVPTPSVGASGILQDNSTGNGKPQTKDGSSQGGDKAAKNQDVSTASSPAPSFNPAVAATAPLVHSPSANLESANLAISPLTTPMSSQQVGLRSESSGGGADVAAAPGTSQGTSAVAELQPINTARVLQSMNGTEMRVGIHSQEFGSISIATSVSPGGIAAQIALDHGALSRALASHLPAIEDKLGSALGVSARVEVRGGGAQTSPGTDAQSSGGGASAGGGSQRGTQGGLTAGYAPQRSAEAAYANAVPEGAISKAGDGGRLSVQA